MQPVLHFIPQRSNAKVLFGFCQQHFPVSFSMNTQSINYICINRHGQWCRTLTELSQRPTPLPMSIYANVIYGLRIHGERDRKVLLAKAEQYLRIASLWDEVKDRLHEPAAALSIGQQQRLCLARGLAVEPEIILGDEPTSALDPISSKWIEEKFVELKEKYTIILVTHILRQARRISDYIVFMYLGEIIEQGPAMEILE